MAGLSCECPPWSTRQWAVRHSMVGGQRLSAVSVHCGHGSVRRRELTLHRTADKEAFGHVAVMAMGRSPIHSLKLMYA